MVLIASRLNVYFACLFMSCLCKRIGKKPLINCELNLIAFLHTFVLLARASVSNTQVLELSNHKL